MKSCKLYLLLLTIACFTFCCNTEEDDLSKTIRKGVLLEIMEGQTTYIGEIGNHYYTSGFLHAKDSILFRLKIKEGVKYHMFSLNPDIEQYDIHMTLLNAKFDIISLSVNTGNKTEIFFTPSTSEDLYLWVKTATGPFEFQLYFEECRPANLSWMGYDWQYSGNWKARDAHSLEFEGANSGLFRWIRLDSDIPDHMDMSFSIKSENSFPSFGVIFHGESTLLNVGLYREELPQKGVFFNIQSNEKYRIYNVDRTGVAYENQTYSIAGMDFKNGISINLNHANLHVETISVNNVTLRSFPKSTLKGIYLVVEDKGFDKVIFENITMKEDAILSDYEGAWFRPVPTDESMRIYEGREVISFTGNQMENKLQVFDKTINEWVTYNAAKANLSMHNNMMNVHVYESCISEYDPFKSRFTGVMKCEGEDSYMFTTNLPQFWMRKDFIFGYHVSNNNLTIAFDKNNNGDYTEQGEKLEYTRMTR